jgi:DNA-binding XRE family transcriptional regulator
MGESISAMTLNLKQLGRDTVACPQGLETRGQRMAEPKPEIRERANRNHSAILRALRTVTQAKAADAMGVSETALSRMKDNLLPELAALLAACSLKVVPEGSKVYTAQRIQALTVLAREALDPDGADSGFDEAL